MIFHEALGSILGQCPRVSKALCQCNILEMTILSWVLCLRLDEVTATTTFLAIYTDCRRW